MAIVHDIAEAIVGDITPSDGVPKEEKSRREQEALDHMCSLLGGGPRGNYPTCKSNILTFFAMGVKSASILSK
jgi:5'-deoxynucleotidase YfbR-like HD superfamily hydrolase